MKIFLNCLFNLLKWIIQIAVLAYLFKISMYHLIAMLHFGHTK